MEVAIRYHHRVLKYFFEILILPRYTCIYARVHLPIRINTTHTSSKFVQLSYCGIPECNESSKIFRTREKLV